MPKKTEADATAVDARQSEAIVADAMYRVILARPVRIAGIALHPIDPDVTVSGAILETIRPAVASFVKV